MSDFIPFPYPPGDVNGNPKSIRDVYFFESGQEIKVVVTAEAGGDSRVSPLEDTTTIQ